MERDDEGNITNVINHAKAEDYIKLGLAAIFAAYSRKDEDAPIKAEEILYDAEPGEVQNLINTVMELRAKWYEVSPVVAEKSDIQESTEEAENDDKPKNA